jgi:Mrp family chromosome partitioning ATPase
VEKAINMANMMNIPLLGLVENMSYVECGKCGEHIHIFGESHIDEIADKYGIPVLARIPMREGFAAAGDQGRIEELIVPEIKAVADTAEKLG